MMVAKHFDRFNEVGLSYAYDLVKMITERGGIARIDSTWMDYGQSWAWETILVDSRIGWFQLLTPRDFKEMNEGRFDRFEELVERALK